ncbi:MAG: hypothetical protein WC543_02680 [Candidatus Omnitrophota bacterium]
MRIFCLTSILILTMTICGWTYDNTQTKTTVSGTVADVDWIKSMLTVSYIDPFSGNTDEVNIIIPDDAKITRGTTDISLSDILQSDPVTVTYYDDGVSGLKAIRIADLNLATL